MFFIIGVAAGFWFSYSFIFPHNLLSFKLANIAVGDIFLILGGLAVIQIGGWIGLLIGRIGLLIGHRPKIATS